MSHLLSDRRFKVLAGAVVAATAASQWSASTAEAAPLFNLQLLGRDATTNPGGAFTATVTVANAGDVIEYQLVGNMSPVGTVYTGTTGAVAITITSLTAGPDGAQSVRLDAFELVSDQIQVNITNNETFQNGWNSIVDFSAGQNVPRGNGNTDVTGIRPGKASGVFGAINPEVIMTGAMNVTATGTGADSLVRVRWSSGSGGMHVNGNGLGRFPSLTTENGTAPLISYAPLTLVAPEPGSLSLLSLAGLGLLARRRKD